MTLPVDPAERHRAVAAGFTERVGAVTDWDAPSPVAAWKTRDVVRHLVESFPSFLEHGAGSRWTTDRTPTRIRSRRGRCTATPCRRCWTIPRRPRRCSTTGTSARYRCPRLSTASTPTTSSCTPGTSPGAPASTTGWTPTRARTCSPAWSRWRTCWPPRVGTARRVAVPDDADAQTRLLGLMDATPPGLPGAPGASQAILRPCARSRGSPPPLLRSPSSVAGRWRPPVSRRRTTPPVTQISALAAHGADDRWLMTAAWRSSVAPPW